MIANGKELYAFLTPILKSHGFIKKQDTYYKGTSDCIVYFTIGKTPPMSRYSYAFGGFYKPLLPPDVEFPKYNHNHLFYPSMYFITKDNADRIFNLSNDEYKGSEREALIKELLETRIFPFLEDISSAEGIKNAVKKYEDLIYTVKGVLREALGI